MKPGMLMLLDRSHAVLNQALLTALWHFIWFMMHLHIRRGRHHKRRSLCLSHKYWQWFHIWNMQLLLHYAYMPWLVMKAFHCHWNNNRYDTEHFVAFYCWHSKPILYKCSIEQTSSLDCHALVGWHLSRSDFSFVSSVCQGTRGPVGGSGTPGLSMDTWQQNRLFRTRSQALLSSLEQSNAQIFCSPEEVCMLLFAEILDLNQNLVQKCKSCEVVLVPVLQQQI